MTMSLSPGVSGVIIMVTLSQFNMVWKCLEKETNYSE